MLYRCIIANRWQVVGLAHTTFYPTRLNTLSNIQDTPICRPTQVSTIIEQSSYHRRNVFQRNLLIAHCLACTNPRLESANDQSKASTQTTNTWARLVEWHSSLRRPKHKPILRLRTRSHHRRTAFPALRPVPPPFLRSSPFSFLPLTSAFIISY